MKVDWFDRLAGHPLLLPRAVRAENGSDNVMALLGELRASERLPAADLGQRQRAALQVLAGHAAAQSPHFAARLQAAGLEVGALAQAGGLAMLPPLTRRELAGAAEALFCRTWPAAHGAAVPTSTSGSTGEPVTVRRTGRCRLYWLAYALREHLWHDRDFGGRLAVVRAHFSEPVEVPDWGPPCNLLFQTGMGSARPITSSLQQLCAWLARFEPDYLLALPTIVEGIVAELEASGRRLGRLRGIRTLSETVHPRLREASGRVLGVPIHDSYTSQEAGIMATQCPEEGGYHVSETILLEVLDPCGQPCAPGQTGRIVVTDLINFATPLIRYEIGDYAEVGAPCACGRGLPVIRRFLGRERNLLLLPDGSRHWPTVGFHRWSEAHPVRQFQFVQLDRETILARMSAPTRPAPEQEAQLTGIIQSALQHPFEIRYEWHEAPLPRGVGGKFEEFLCRAE
jgi:phenylacetate-CoA ligase